MATLDTIYNDIKLISNRIDKIEQGQNFTAAKYEEIAEMIKSGRTETGKIREEQSQQGNRIIQLEKRLRISEQVQVENKVILSGIPETKGENMEQIIDTIAKTARLDLVVNTAHRLGAPKNGKIRLILINLDNKNQAKQLIQFSRRAKPMSNAISHSFEPGKSMFISPYMTTETMRLWTATYTRAKAKGYKYIWTSNGEILIRRSDKDKLKVINCIEDAEELDDEPDPQ